MVNWSIFDIGRYRRKRRNRNKVSPLKVKESCEVVSSERQIKLDVESDTKVEQVTQSKQERKSSAYCYTPVLPFKNESYSIDSQIEYAFAIEHKQTKTVAKQESVIASCSRILNGTAIETSMEDNLIGESSSSTIAQDRSIETKQTETVAETSTTIVVDLSAGSTEPNVKEGTSNTNNIEKEMFGLSEITGLKLGTPIPVSSESNDSKDACSVQILKVDNDSVEMKDTEVDVKEHSPKAPNAFDNTNCFEMQPLLLSDGTEFGSTRDFVDFILVASMNEIIEETEVSEIIESKIILEHSPDVPIVQSKISSEEVIVHVAVKSNRESRILSDEIIEETEISGVAESKDIVLEHSPDVPIVQRSSEEVISDLGVKSDQARLLCDGMEFQSTGDFIEFILESSKSEIIEEAEAQVTDSKQTKDDAPTIVAKDIIHEAQDQITDSKDTEDDAPIIVADDKEFDSIEEYIKFTIDTAKKEIELKKEESAVQHSEVLVTEALPENQDQDRSTAVCSNLEIFNNENIVSENNNTAGAKQTDTVAERSTAIFSDILVEHTEPTLNNDLVIINKDPITETVQENDPDITTNQAEKVNPGEPEPTEVQLTEHFQTNGPGFVKFMEYKARPLESIPNKLCSSEDVESSKRPSLFGRVPLKPRRPNRSTSIIDEEERIERMGQLKKYASNIYDYIENVYAEKKVTKQDQIVKQFITEGRVLTKRPGREFCSYDKRSVDELELLQNQEHLLRAAWKGKSTKLEQMLRDPFFRNEINRADCCGRTALHYAASYGDLDMLKSLAAVEALDFNLRDEEGKTALFKAVEIGAVESVRFLTGLVNPDIAANDGRTPIDFCLQEKGDLSLEMIKIFIEAKAVLYELDYPTIVTSLHILSMAHSELPIEATCKLLLDNYADPNSQDENGITPLMFAALNGNVNMVKLLLASNCWKAIPTITDNQNRDALSYCANDECFQAIEEAKINFEVYEDMKAEFGSSFMRDYYES